MLRIDPPTYKVCCDGPRCHAVACERQPTTRQAEETARVLGWQQVGPQWFCEACWANVAVPVVVEPEPPTLASLLGTFRGCTGGKSAVEFVRGIRDGVQDPDPQDRR